METLFTEEELQTIESDNPSGMSSGDVVDAFVKRGARFSEATFRKYVQLGLLPRSRRVGSKGKHKGSKGVYPACVVRQINEIKQMMGLGYTIEDIRRYFAFVGGEVEELRTLLGRIVEKLEDSLRGEEHEVYVADSMRLQLAEAKTSAESLVSKLEDMAKRIRELRLLAKEAV